MRRYDAALSISIEDWSVVDLDSAVSIRRHCCTGGILKLQVYFEQVKTAEPCLHVYGHQSHCLMFALHVLASPQALFITGSSSTARRIPGRHHFVRVVRRKSAGRYWTSMLRYGQGWSRKQFAGPYMVILAFPP